MKSQKRPSLQRIKDDIDSREDSPLLVSRVSFYTLVYLHAQVLRVSNPQAVTSMYLDLLGVPDISEYEKFIPKGELLRPYSDIFSYNDMRIVQGGFTDKMGFNSKSKHKAVLAMLTHIAVTKNFEEASRRVHTCIQQNIPQLYPALTMRGYPRINTEYGSIQVMRIPQETLIFLEVYTKDLLEFLSAEADIVLRHCEGRTNIRPYRWTCLTINSVLNQVNSLSSEDVLSIDKVASEKFSMSRVKC